MRFRRVLVAVDDSPEGLAAARAAVELAAEGGGRVRAVTVLRDHVLGAALGGASQDAQRRLAHGRVSLLTWVAELAARHDVPCETVARDGEPFRCILEEVTAWDADLVVMGRSERRGTMPALGSVTTHVLEFAERPVLVVPHRTA